jgi:MarR family transcriptional regulator, organic hydroperoxide resistance regulator
VQSSMSYSTQDGRNGPGRAEGEAHLPEGSGSTATDTAAGQPGAVRQASEKQRLTHLLVQIALRRDRAVSDILAPLGLSLSQWRVMIYLSAVPNASMGEVADYVVIDRTSLTRAVDKLVEAQLLNRTASAHDRRITTLRLTAAGQEVCARILARVGDHSERLLEAAADADVACAVGVLENMLARLIEDRARTRRVADVI